MNFQVTTKESGLLKDMKTQEELCIKKYENYAKEAHCAELKALFESMANTEREHLKTVCEMMNGTVNPIGNTISNSDNCHCGCAGYSNEEDRRADAFLCQDMLATEKHASSLYDVSVFEFGEPMARKALNHIQAEEQQHGEKLYAFMKANNMY